MQFASFAAPGGALAAAFLLVASLCACSNDAVPDVVIDAASDDASDSTADTSVADTSAPDSSVPADTHVEETADAPVDGAKPDTSFDVAVDSAGTMFACGASTCSSKFQFCHRATSPGICPTPDSGVCPAGCPGCGPLPTTCESLPSDCFAYPSCPCIVTKVCGSSLAGTCTETDGGYTVGCNGV